VETLRPRKEADSTATTRFGRHLWLIEAQRRYFDAMQRSSAERVLFLNAHDVGQTVQTVAAAAQERRGGRSACEALGDVASWLRHISAPEAAHEVDVGRCKYSSAM
jgi:hypothetical protein